MLATETEEQREIRKQEEQEYLELLRNQQKEAREFELTKLRIESSIPQRWKGISRLAKYLFVYPITVICITVLLLAKRETKTLDTLLKEEDNKRSK